MSIFSRLFEKRYQGAPGEWYHWISQAVESIFKADSGITVTPDTAMQCMAVYACVTLISETIASLPLMVYRRLDGGGKEPAVDHALYPILHDSPNPDYTAFEFRQAQAGHLCLRGNHYAVKIMRGSNLIRLEPLNPDRMKVTREDGKLIYEYRHEDEKVERWDRRFIWHTRGMLANDGVLGLSPIGVARNAIGLALGAEKYGATFYKNAARPTGILHYEGKLNDDAKGRIKAQWTEGFTGEKANSIALLDKSMSWTPLSMSNEDAQFLETRGYQIAEIARLYHVPPHMIADLTRATFSNIEEQSIEFVVYCLRPWLVRIEQSANMNLLSVNERKDYFIEHKVDGLLRGNMAERYAAYQSAIMNTWMSPNEVRALENLNPRVGGDVYENPNVKAAENFSKMNNKPSQEGDEGEDEE